MSKIRIGILIREFDQLFEYEYLILNKIIEDSDYEIALLIKDTRINLNSTYSKFRKNILTKDFLANVLLKVQKKLESKLFTAPKVQYDKKMIIDHLNKVHLIKLSPERKGFLDIFSKEDSELIKSFNLDVILRHEFNIIRGEILNSAKYGIWSFHHADNDLNRGSAAGFWEVALDKSYVGATLQQLTPELDGGNIIDKAKFNWHFSYALTHHILLTSSVNLLIKNLEKLKRGVFQTTNSTVYYKPLYRKPTLKYVLLYLLRFYSSILEKICIEVLHRLKFLRKYCWALFYSKGEFLSKALYKIKEVEMPKNEFWADPFLFKKDGVTYAFFENYEYDKKKAKISCAKIEKNKFLDIKDALDLPYHLSYPMLIEEDGQIYMMPECHKNNRLEVYKSVSFPDRWELYSTAFENEEIVDSTYFQDDQGDRWLFVNKGYYFKPELYIYKIDSLSLNSITPHLENPVQIDTISARNAGGVFKYQGKWHRPNQVNSHGKYGNAININRIEELTLEKYVETKVFTVKPHFKPGLVGMHHLHQIDGEFIFDALYRHK